MTRPTRPLAGVTPDDIETQRALARGLASNAQLASAQDTLIAQVAQALQQAGFSPLTEARARLETMGNGITRDVSNDWLDPANDVQMVLRCTFYARFAGPQTGHTRLTLTLVQKPEAGASRLDEHVAAHQLVVSTPPPATRQFEAHPETGILAQWGSAGLLEGGHWAELGVPEFVALANRHFAR